MGTVARCCGIAHSTKPGDLHEAMHRENPAAIAFYSTDDRFDIPPRVSLHDQLESLVAIGCSCARHHVALPLPRPRFLPPQPWDPTQADGSDPLE